MVEAVVARVSRPLFLQPTRLQPQKDREKERRRLADL